MFHKVTLQTEITMSRSQCSGGTRIECRPKRARMNSPAAPAATHKPRKVQTGNSANVIFIIGQFNPQPNVSKTSRTHIERGKVCCCADIRFSKNREVYSNAAGGHSKLRA
jgi:hypothetical protein